MGTEIKSPDDFLAGQIACQNGEECCQGASKDFERGYMAQYAAEQIADTKTENPE